MNMNERKPVLKDTIMNEAESASVIFGRNAVLEALKSDTPINQIFLTDMKGSLGAICAEAKKRGILI